MRRADRERGRFRALLLTALHRYVISEIRRNRRGPATITDPAGVADSVCSPAEAYEVAWARAVIGKTLARMKAACANGRADLWGVFESRLVRPALHGAEVPPYASIVEQFGFQSPMQAANALTTGKRMFQRILREEVSEYAADDAEVDAEIAELLGILSRAGA